MKRIIFLIFFISFNLYAEELAYFQKFFDETKDFTHDPDYPETVLVNAKNDLWQVVQDGEHAQGVLFVFSLKEEGKYSFYKVDVVHKWENNRRFVKLGPCKAFNGKWEHRDGKLFLDKHIALKAAYEDGQNLLSPEFLNLSLPSHLANLKILIAKNGFDSFGNSLAKNDFQCVGFVLPFWIPIPEKRPW